MKRILTLFAWPQRRLLALAGFLMALEAAASLVIPWLAGQFAGRFFDSQTTGAADKLVVLLLAAFAVLSLLKFLSRFVASRAGETISAHLRTEVFEHLQALPLSHFTASRRGDRLALITSDAARLGDYIASTLVGTVPMLLALCGALLLMARIDPVLTLAISLAMPLFYVLLKVVGRKIRPLSLAIQKEEANLVAVAEENLAVLPLIKAFSEEAAGAAKFNAHSTTLLRLTLRMQAISSALTPAIEFIAAAFVVLVLWLAGSRTDSGTLSPPDLVSFFLYAALLTRPVGSLAAVYGVTQGARGAVARLQGVLGEPTEPLGSEGTVLDNVRGAIAFLNVTFAYPSRAAVLDQAYLDIRAGETVAITGANGAGKSTLVHLLLRFYTPQSGSITIDGTDIATANLKSLRASIGLVSQRVLLFNASIKDNIAVGKPGATLAEIEQASRSAEAYEFISEFPEGFDTIIGDGGVRLSGGQRQRLALARALLKNPPILILDEATAMFDPEGERAFIERSRPQVVRRTVILITHRPASLALADRIVKLERGRFAANRRTA